MQPAGRLGRGKDAEWDSRLDPLKARAHLCCLLSFLEQQYVFSGCKVKPVATTFSWPPNMENSNLLLLWQVY